jgi:hypothetical protein
MSDATNRHWGQVGASAELLSATRWGDAAGAGAEVAEGFGVQSCELEAVANTCLVALVHRTA